MRENKNNSADVICGVVLPLIFIEGNAGIIDYIMFRRCTACHIS